MVRKIYNHFMTDPLYRSSIFVMLSTLIMAVLGFFFWIVVARLFPVKNVGIATTLISVGSLLSNFSLLGLNIGLIRYLPKSTQRNEKINSALLLVVLAAVLSTFVFISGLHIFSPKLSFLQTSPLYIVMFVLFVIAVTLNAILDSIFMAYRASGNILIKNSILSALKLLFPLVLVIIGAYGIFASVAIATLAGVVVGFVILFLKFNYKPTFSFNKKVIKQMSVFSGANYIASFLSQAPSLILPLFIINYLSSEVAAYFYMDMMILSFLTIISGSATQSLLAEGSYDETELKSHFIKAMKVTFLFLIPAIVIIVLFGNFILHAFGKNYAADAFEFLQLISISAIFIAISSLGNAILRVRRQMVSLIVISILGDIFVLGFSYMFINSGLTGIGWGWLLGRMLSAIIYIPFFGKDILSKPALLINNFILKYRTKRL